MWKDEMRRRASMTESERLREEADAEERRGDQFKGCLWMGDEHPSMLCYRRAEDLRRLAALLEKPQRDAQRRKATREQRHRDFVDSLIEDRDW